MKTISLAAAAAGVALLTAACGPAPEDDVDDVEELPDQDDLGEPDRDGLEDVQP